MLSLRPGEGREFRVGSEKRATFRVPLHKCGGLEVGLSFLCVRRHKSGFLVGEVDPHLHDQRVKHWTVANLGILWTVGVQQIIEEGVSGVVAVEDIGIGPMLRHIGVEQVRRPNCRGGQVDVRED